MLQKQKSWVALDRSKVPRSVRRTQRRTGSRLHCKSAIMADYAQQARNLHATRAYKFQKNRAACGRAVRVKQPGRDAENSTPRLV